MSDTKMVTVKVSGDTKSKLDKLCEENGLKMRWVVERAINKYCDKHQNKVDQTAARFVVGQSAKSTHYLFMEAEILGRKADLCELMIVSEVSPFQKMWVSQDKLDGWQWPEEQNKETIACPSCKEQVVINPHLCPCSACGATLIGGTDEPYKEVKDPQAGQNVGFWLAVNNNVTIVSEESNGYYLVNNLSDHYVWVKTENLAAGQEEQ